MLYFSISLSIPIPTVAANIIGFSLMYILNRRKKFFDKDTAGYFVKVLFSAVIMGVLVYVTRILLGTVAQNKITGLFVPVAVGVVSYFVCCILFGVNELRDILNLVLNKFKK